MVVVLAMVMVMVIVLARLPRLPRLARLKLILLGQQFIHSTQPSPYSTTRGYALDISWTHRLFEEKVDKHIIRDKETRRTNNVTHVSIVGLVNVIYVSIGFGRHTGRARRWIGPVHSYSTQCGKLLHPPLQTTLR